MRARGTKFLDHTKLLLDGVRSVVEDEGFQLPSPPAVKALDAATSLLEWITGCEANRAIPLTKIFLGRARVPSLGLGKGRRAL